MIYRVSIRDLRPWRKLITADSELEALKIALDKFRSERNYEPIADDVFVERDIEQFFLGRCDGSK